MLFVMAKLNNIVMLIDKEDVYHDWILYDFGQRFKIPIRVIEADKRKISRLKYTSLIDRNEILYIKDEEKKLYEMYEDIKKVNTRKRVLVISAQSKHLVEKIEKDFKDRRIIKFPELKTYKQKRDYVIKILQRWGVEYSEKEVEVVLIRNMVRNVMTWEDVKLLWEIYEYNGDVFNLDTIEDIYPDEEFHRLDDFILGVLKGQWRNKGTQMASYFLDVREYSPEWLLKKVQEVYANVGLFFQAYRGGVLILPESAGRVEERVRGLEWENGLRLVDFTEIDQEKYLEVVKEMPYQHYVKIAKHVLSLKGSITKGDIYKMIESIKKVRSDLSEYWGKNKRVYKGRKR